MTGELQDCLWSKPEDGAEGRGNNGTEIWEIPPELVLQTMSETAKRIAEV